MLISIDLSFNMDVWQKTFFARDQNKDLRPQIKQIHNFYFC